MEADVAVLGDGGHVLRGLGRLRSQPAAPVVGRATEAARPRVAAPEPGVDRVLPGDGAAELVGRLHLERGDLGQLQALRWHGAAATVHARAGHLSQALPRTTARGATGRRHAALSDRVGAPNPLPPPARTDGWFSDFDAPDRQPRDDVKPVAAIMSMVRSARLNG